MNATSHMPRSTRHTPHKACRYLSSHSPRPGQVFLLGLGGGVMGAWLLLFVGDLGGSHALQGLMLAVGCADAGTLGPWGSCRPCRASSGVTPTHARCATLDDPGPRCFLPYTPHGHAASPCRPTAPSPRLPPPHTTPPPLQANCAAEVPAFYLRARVPLSPTALLHTGLAALVLRLALYAALPALPGVPWPVLLIELLQARPLLGCATTPRADATTRHVQSLQCRACPAAFVA
jgi:hypothetical protein